MAKAMKTSTIAPNLVDHQFRARGVRKNLLTDITYLFYKNGKCHLSNILDASTHDALADELREDLHVEFVLETVDCLVKEHGSTLDNAPQESFFGHMNDEINEKIAACKTFAEIKVVVEDWLDYYDKDRYQWDLLKL